MLWALVCSHQVPCKSAHAASWFFSLAHHSAAAGLMCSAPAHTYVGVARSWQWQVQYLLTIAGFARVGELFEAGCTVSIVVSRGATSRIHVWSFGLSQVVATRSRFCRTPSLFHTHASTVPVYHTSTTQISIWTLQWRQRPMRDKQWHSLARYLLTP